tara:strand:- start:509 stop:811 length:303 start_codon:yes stop_codon:yes gene_type:complete
LVGVDARVGVLSNHFGTALQQSIGGVFRTARATLVFVVRLATATSQACSSRSNTLVHVSGKRTEKALGAGLLVVCEGGEKSFSFGVSRRGRQKSQHCAAV